ncbi:MAG: FtsQ-type POTRA domain-containing protein [Proteobacteria bacterium]|nr:FtsQ-type POTRA domain-containing protein [Pseudomonadota bacterium]
MSQKLKRGGPSARAVAARADTGRKIRKARAQTGGLFGELLAMLPFSESQLHRLFLAMILGAAASLAWIVASMAGVPAMAREQLAAVAKDSGFEVRRVEVRGVQHLNELKIYERVLAERDRAMPLVDLAALRGQLLELSWVEDARVSRQLPDTLVIDVVERKPHAVLKTADRLALIDERGHVLEPIAPARAKGRLVIGGWDAAHHVGELNQLLDAAPALRPQVAEADWIGNRRWNLTFKTGQVLALPEGGQASSGALVAFARLDGTNRLLGGRVAAFDMRAPDRIYLRIPGRTDGGTTILTAGTPAATPASATEAR